jgi:O-antigen/teichoic acid export membrane protein
MKIPAWDALQRNAFSLMSTTGLTSVLGLVFWIVAARRYSTAVVGSSSATIALGTLLATLASLNLSAVITRLLPRTGVRTRWFVLRSYTVTGGLALVLGLVVVVAGLQSSIVGDTPGGGLGVVLLTLGLLFFSLQDSVLTGLGRAPVVLLENGIFATVKLLALVPLAVLMPTSGVVVAWAVPLFFAVIAVNVFLFGWAIPRHEQEADGASEVPPRRRLASFVSAEYARQLLSTATTWALPLIVTVRLGHVQEAYFWIPWLALGACQQLPYGISTAYVVESSFAGAQSAVSLRRSLRLGALVVTATTLGMLLVVPLVLGLAGPGYAEGGTTLTRILAITLPFNALNALYGTFAWIEQRLWRLVALQLANVVVLFGGSLLFLDRWGIAAVGWSYLASQVVLGLGSLVPILRRLRRLQPFGPSPHLVGVTHEPDGMTLDLVGDDDDRAARP